MNLLNTELNPVIVIQRNAFEDERGLFSKLFCEETLTHNGVIETALKQVNFSQTNTQGCVRGIHFQKPPYVETKIVSCIEGAIFDVAVDLRKDSNTFLQWFGVELNATNHKSLVIPAGFGHAFQVLSERASMVYCHSQSYHPEHEGGIHYADKGINIQWPQAITLTSDKDKNYPPTTFFQGI